MSDIVTSFWSFVRPPMTTIRPSESRVTVWVEREEGPWDSVVMSVNFSDFVSMPYKPCEKNVPFFEPVKGSNFPPNRTTLPPEVATEPSSRQRNGWVLTTERAGEDQVSVSVSYIQSMGAV